MSINDKPISFKWLNIEDVAKMQKRKDETIYYHELNRPSTFADAIPSLDETDLLNGENKPIDKDLPFPEESSNIIGDFINNKNPEIPVPAYYTGTDKFNLRTSEELPRGYVPPKREKKGGKTEKVVKNLISAEEYTKKIMNYISYNFIEAGINMQEVLMQTYSNGSGMSFKYGDRIFHIDFYEVD